MKPVDHNFHHPLKAFRLSDALLMILFLAIAMACIPFMRSQQPGTIQVYKADKLIAEYPLSEERVFTVDGEIGPVSLEVKKGQAHILSSTCRNQVCVHAGWIDKPYQQIICAPNRIMVTVESRSGKRGIDAISR